MRMHDEISRIHLATSTPLANSATRYARAPPFFATRSCSHSQRTDPKCNIASIKRVCGSHTMRNRTSRSAAIPPGLKYVKALRL